MRISHFLIKILIKRNVSILIFLDIEMPKCYILKDTDVEGCWEDHDLALYNCSKNKYVGCDVKCYKKLGYVADK